MKQVHFFWKWFFDLFASLVRLTWLNFKISNFVKIILTYGIPDFNEDMRV